MLPEIARTWPRTLIRRETNNHLTNGHVLFILPWVGYHSRLGVHQKEEANSSDKHDTACRAVAQCMDGRSAHFLFIHE